MRKKNSEYTGLIIIMCIGLLIPILCAFATGSVFASGGMYDAIIEFDIATLLIFVLLLKALIGLIGGIFKNFGV